MSHSNFLQPQPSTPFVEVLLQEGEAFRKQPWRYFMPLVRTLDELHSAGQPHLGLRPEILQFREGILDATLIRRVARDSARLDASIRTYYPLGFSEELAEQKSQDLWALGALFFFAVKTHSVPLLPPADGVYFSTPTEGWPTEFVQVTEKLLGNRITSIAEVREIFEKALHASDPATSSPSDPAAPEPTASESAPPREAERVAAATPGDVEHLAADPTLLTTAAVPQQQPPPTIHLSARLPNGTVNKEYRVSLRDFLPATPGISAMVVVGDAPGITLVDKVLMGTPTQAGDFPFEVRFYFAEPQPDRPKYVAKTITLTINPDPRSLWKDLPSDPNMRFWKPDCDSAAVERAPLALFAASRRGRSHAHEGGSRDDDFKIQYWPWSNWYAMIVADGAGSAAYSRRGSQIACDTALSRLAQKLGNEAPDAFSPHAEAFVKGGGENEKRQFLVEAYQLLGGAAIEARKAIEAEAAALDAQLQSQPKPVTPRDFHTTLIIVLAKHFPQGWAVATFSIGDGAAGAAGVPEGMNPLLTKPDGGEFAGQTTFLTVKEALADGNLVLKRLKVEAVPQFSALIALTDGVTDPIFVTDAALELPEKWDDLLTQLNAVAPPNLPAKEQAERVLEWLNFWSTGNHDDRTIAVLRGK